MTQAQARPVGVLAAVEPPRVAGLAGAGLSLGGDPDLGCLNPAAPAASPLHGVSFFGSRGGFDVTTGGVRGAFVSAGGVATADIGYLDTGRVTAETADGSLASFTAQRDVGLAIGFAMTAGAGVALGTTIRYRRSELAQTYTAGMFTVDAGVQVRAGELVRLGLAVVDAGPAIRYRNESAPAPLAIRGGVAIATSPAVLQSRGGERDSGLLVVLDVHSVPAESTTWVRVGAEYRLAEFLALRAGWKTGTGGALGGPTAGLSATLTRSESPDRTRYRLDYAVENGSGPLERTHTLGLAIGWSTGDLEAERDLMQIP